MNGKLIDRSQYLSLLISDIGKSCNFSNRGNKPSDNNKVKNYCKVKELTHSLTDLLTSTTATRRLATANTSRVSIPVTNVFGQGR